MVSKRTTTLSPLLDKLSLCCDPTRIRLFYKLKNSFYNAVNHLPENENIIRTIWKRAFVIMMFAFKSKRMRNLILSTHASHRGNKWASLLEKLASNDLTNANEVSFFLFHTLLNETLSNQNVFKPFWTPAYKELSANLFSPIVSTTEILQHKNAQQFITTVEMKPPSNTNCFNLTSSVLADKWEKEVIPTEQLKSIKIQLKPNAPQKKILNEWIDTSRYVYNKAVEEIYKNKHKAHFESLRDKLVTANTKKYDERYVGIRTTIRDLQTQRKHQVGLRNDDNLLIIQSELDRIDRAIKEERKKIISLPAQKNQGVREWELQTPKEVRAGAVDDVCKAIKTGFSNLKNGNIRHFRLKFKKQTEPDKCMLVPKNYVTNIAGDIQIAPLFFKEHSKFHMGKRTKKKHGGIEINYDTRIVRQKKTYWIIIPVPQSKSEKRKPDSYCGIDPGVRTFMTVFGDKGVTEYKHRAEALRELDRKIRSLQYSRIGRKNRIRKKKIEKVEYRKANLVNELHWKTINNLTKNNNFIFYGNINSHSIVKNGKNPILNRDVNNLKFYQFKTRLLFKAQERGCKVHLVHEAYTSKTCSFCGCLTNVGDSKIYTCRECKQVVDRDINASKNILMKGILTSVS